MPALYIRKRAWGRARKKRATMRNVALRPLQHKHAHSLSPATTEQAQSTPNLFGLTISSVLKYLLRLIFYINFDNLFYSKKSYKKINIILPQ
jgi:hypothetical protein